MYVVDQIFPGFRPIFDRDGGKDVKVLIVSISLGPLGYSFVYYSLFFDKSFVLLSSCIGCS